MRKIENRPAMNAGRQFLLGALVLLVPGVGAAQGGKVATRQLGAPTATSTPTPMSILRHISLYQWLVRISRPGIQQVKKPTAMLP